MLPSGRQFSCARCSAEVVLCTQCDHGNVYCGSTCSTAARRASVRAAGRRHQRTEAGAIGHARRQATYRAAQARRVVTENPGGTPRVETVPTPEPPRPPVQSDFLLFRDASGFTRAPTPDTSDAVVAARCGATAEISMPVKPVDESSDPASPVRHGALAQGETSAAGLPRCRMCGRLCGPVVRDDPVRRRGPQHPSRPPPRPGADRQHTLQDWRSRP